MSDLAHSLLSAALPTRQAVCERSRTLSACALELAAAVSQYHHVWSLRHDPDALRSEGSRDALADVRYRGMVRGRLWAALEDYLRASRNLLQEATRGAFLSESEAEAKGKSEAMRAYLISTTFEDEIPF